MNLRQIFSKSGQSFSDNGEYGLPQYVGDSGNVSLSQFIGMNTKGKVKLTYDTAMGITAYWRGLNLIADRMVELPLSIVDAKGQPATNNNIQTLLEDGVAKWYDPTDFVRTITVHLLTHGNFYALINSTPGGLVESLEFLTPDSIQPYILDGNLVYRYTKKSGIQTVLLYDEVFHVKGLSRDGLVGISPIAACKDTLRLALQATGFGGEFFDNMALPSTLLTMDSKRQLSDEQQNKVLSKFKRMFGAGGDRQGVGIFGGISGVHQLTIPPDSAQFLETRQESVRDVGRVLGIPAQLLGDTSSSTYNNIQSMYRALTTDTLTPLATRIVSAINKQLLKKPYTARFDFTNAVQEPMLDRYRAHQIALGGEPFMSVGEVRLMEGYEEEFERDFNFPTVENQNEQT